MESCFWLSGLQVEPGLLFRGLQVEPGLLFRGLQVEPAPVITFSCYRRMALLGSERAGNTFVEILDEVRDRYFLSGGLQVEPAPVRVGRIYGHAEARSLACAKTGDGRRQAPPLLRKMHEDQRVSRRLRRKRKFRAGQLELALENGEELPVRFWQRRFFDFNVRSLKKRVEKLECTHTNPLERGLAAHRFLSAGSK